MRCENLEVNKLKVSCEPYIIDTPIEGIFAVKRPRYGDSRGSFQELVRIPDISKRFQETQIDQSQISVSKVNVLRGIHAEPRDKIVTPILGRMAAVVVDLRVGSPTFKMWVRFDFDNTNPENEFTTLFVPSGCGNSLCVYKNPDDAGDGTVIYHYTYSSIYDPKWSGSGVRYNDPQLDIIWPIKNPVLSDRDKELPLLDEFIKKYR